MPIYHKTPPPSTVGNHNTAEIDYHTSEAAKVKRTREQAYFNSYDFDAIEVLPYDDEEDEDDGGKAGHTQRERERRQLKSTQTRPQQQITTHHHHHQHHYRQQQQQQQQLKPQQISNHSSSTNSFMTDNRQQHQHQHHHHPLHNVTSKSNPSIYLQRLSSIFASKTSNSSNKLQAQPMPQQQQQLQHQHHNKRYTAGSVSGVGNKDISIAVNALSHDNKHLKLSSSETSSTTLSSSSIVEEILNVDNVGGVASEAIAIASGLLPIESTRDVTAIGSRTTTSDTANTNVKTTTSGGTGGPVASSTSATAAVSVTTINTVGNAGNFLLPRAMLKYQSSTLNTQQGAAAGTTAGTTTSMPLATNVSSTSSNNNSPTSTRRQQQHHNHQRDVHKLDTIKGKNPIMPPGGTNPALRLKKTSNSSSVITSLASEDIEEDRDRAENAASSKLKKEEKVLPKTINKKVSARALSHQSHYSTDKSASSGYYSSNVCSTYSLEEHIYSEPTLDIKKLRNNAKETKLPLPATSLAAASATTPSTASTLLQSNSKLQHQQHQQHQQQQQQPAPAQPPSSSLLLNSNEPPTSAMPTLEKSRRYRYADSDSQNVLTSNRNSQEFSENLKILESSIENLDRHLKSFPGVVNSQDSLVSYTQNPYNPYVSVSHNDKLRSSASYQHLPTIQESFDVAKKRAWPEEPSDDSLMDIDLDSFLLDKDKKSKGPKCKQALNNNKGVDNPSFLTEEQEENHYKCAKYINSCPDDAYRVESDIIAPAHSSISGQSVAVSVDLYPKRYEEQLHFQNTRELLEDVRDKIRLLTQTQEAKQQQIQAASEKEKDDCIPKELHLMINTLKQELELYLERMNQHSELEIRQLCTGLVKNQHIVKMKNAFERRRSSLGDAPDIYSTYEALQDGIVVQGVPISITQQITSIRCTSDPNFKMKRKSLTEVFPAAECYVESLQTLQQATPLSKTTQLQRNLSYHKPVLEQLKALNANANLKGSTANASGGDTSEPNDKDSILDWHRKKPSIWEMYYGSNRIQQSLLGGKKNGMMVTTTASTSSPSTMCYPSSRPESDFTLDLPRAEQLRIKMEKEKKFRQRCRVITTFLSLVFFLLTVMVVSLVLTRGKRMFGSMI